MANDPDSGDARYPLLPESADALLNALLGEHRTFEPLKLVLIERTEGNPFFRLS
jgi:adenylate cyclase